MLLTPPATQSFILDGPKLNARHNAECIIGSGDVNGRAASKLIIAGYISAGNMMEKWSLYVTPEDVEVSLSRSVPNSTLQL